jgi:signal transduction histidine kinase
MDLDLTNADLLQQRAAAREKGQQLALAEKDSKLQAEIIDRESLLRNVAIIGFILLALISILIVRGLRLRRRASEARAAIAEFEADSAKSDSLRIRAESAEREETAQRRFARQLMHAQEEERQRIASDLHDSLAQKLVVIQNRATLALQRSIDDEYLVKQFESISSTAVDTVGEVRAISHALRPQLLSRFGLSAALRNLVEEINSVTEISWEGNVDDLTGLLAPDDEINLYRIVQEGMNNTIRHADASSGNLNIQRSGHSILVSITDDGKGFDSGELKINGNGGLGFQSMQQRSNLLSAVLQINSELGRGTSITIEIPIPDPLPDAESVSAVTERSVETGSSMEAAS